MWICPIFGYVRTNGGSLEEFYVHGDMSTTCTTRNRQTFDTDTSAVHSLQLLETLESATTRTIIVGVTADLTQSDTGFEKLAGPFFARYDMDLSGLVSREKLRGSPSNIDCIAREVLELQSKLIIHNLNHL